VAPTIEASYEELVDRAEALISRERTMLGIVGAPGAGKSTLAQFLTQRLSERAALLPMDGYHLANEVLVDLGRRDRKGAPDTFDAAGYVALLERLRKPDVDIVYAPKFDRELEEPIGSAIPIAPTIPLIITEGNYLLLDYHPWDVIPTLLDEIWYLQPDDALRQERLIDRHIAFGKEPDAARAWALGTDERNAEVIDASKARADLIITITSEGLPR
jgi:pantothenate kinase